MDSNDGIHYWIDRNESIIDQIWYPNQSNRQNICSNISIFDTFGVAISRRDITTIHIIITNSNTIIFYYINTLKWIYIYWRCGLNAINSKHRTGTYWCSDIIFFIASFSTRWISEELNKGDHFANKNNDILTKKKKKKKRNK